MARLPVRTAVAVGASLLTARVVLAADTAPALGNPIPLSEDDLRSITLQVMQKHPLLASAPGIKHASAQRSVRSTDIASIVYFPHAESNGLKYAFQLRCLRHLPDVAWVCEDPDIRRYLKLDSQDFEIRVTVDVTTEVALALIEATRAAVQAPPAGAQIPNTAILVLRDSLGYMVTWGSPEGYQKVMVRAQLMDAGNPAKPEDWRTKIFETRGVATERGYELGLEARVTTNSSDISGNTCIFVAWMWRYPTPCPRHTVAAPGWAVHDACGPSKTTYAGALSISAQSI